MNKEQQNKLVKELNGFYGNEFAKTKDGKKIYTTFEFSSYQELGSVIHGINNAIQMLGLSGADLCVKPDPTQLGISIEELSKLNQRFLSYSLFDGLDVATNLIE